MALRCGRFYTPTPKISNSEDLSSTGFPASTFCLRLGADVGSPFFGRRSADDKGDVKAERPKAFATDKIFLLHSVFYRRRALPFPFIVCPLLPSKRNRHTPSFERKKNVSTMKTERSYHPQNRFETKRRLLALPQKIVWIVICIAALKAIGTSEELTAILLLLAVFYLVHTTLRMVLRVLFYLIRWICIAAALAWVVCRLLF
ncbi:hypothetical protein [Tannerella serpentiformis]|uniref:hypothetical protein n=1 Tax=Tannerella serpentiformis TaxID=712710 RepID=UPI00131A7575|nr:hypothetical protein [Tannerella serpentiformis]